MAQHTINTFRDWLIGQIEEADADYQRRRFHSDSVAVALMQQRLQIFQAVLAELNGELF